MAENVPIINEPEKKEDERSIFDRVSEAFTPTETTGEEGIGPSVETPSVSVPEITPDTTPPTNQTAVTPEPSSSLETITNETSTSISPPVFAPLDASSITKKKRKNKAKRCKCPTKKKKLNQKSNKKYPRCRDRSKRDNVSKKCKSKMKCSNGYNRDSYTGACKPK